MKPQVVVVGSFVQDLTFQCQNFPRPGQTMLGKMAGYPGGKGSNQAIACARAGAKTLFVGAVGKDSFGRAAEAYYRKERIPAILVAKSKEATGCAAVMIDATGQNQIIVALGANLSLRPADVPAKYFRGVKAVICQLEIGDQATLHALKTARRAGALTVLNPAPMRPDFPWETLRHTDVLIPNEHEFVGLINGVARAKSERVPLTAEKLRAMNDERLQALAQSLEIATVIVTLGDRGCFVSTVGRFLRLPAYSGIQVVDTTGAGDAFVGGFTAAWIEKADVFRAAQYANATAALSVTRAGAAPSMPSRDQVARFLARPPA